MGRHWYMVNPQNWRIAATWLIKWRQIPVSDLMHLRTGNNYYLLTR